MGRLLNTIVIIGAARSGTKIFRDVLATGLSVGAVPYDVGYVWSFGQPRRSHDELRPEELSAKQVNAIRGFVGKYARNGAVIEKTVANSLRVPFVASVFPEAVIVHLVRDGVDVSMSAARQWSTRPSLSYLSKKVRHFPWRLAPIYGRDYVANTLAGRRASGHSRSWGPRYRGMEQDISQMPLELVCARQWAICVNAAQSALPSLRQPVVEVRYEDFVMDPSRAILDVAQATQRTPVTESMQNSIRMVRRSDLGKGRAEVPRELTPQLASELNPTLSQLGYLEVEVP